MEEKKYRAVDSNGVESEVALAKNLPHPEEVAAAEAAVKPAPPPRPTIKPSAPR